MRTKRTFVLAATLLLTANVCTAAHIWEDAGGWWSDHFVMDRSNAPKFVANELSLDLFASFDAPERGIDELFDTDIRDGKWGGGVGLNYFFTREFGLGADINMADNGGNLVDIMQASLFLRLPIESIGLAPYVFGGGGRTTEPVWDWTGHAGLGAELRFNRTTGIFTDARYVWGDDTSDRLMLRAGLRLVF